MKEWKLMGDVKLFVCSEEHNGETVVVFNEEGLCYLHRKNLISDNPTIPEELTPELILQETINLYNIPADFIAKHISDPYEIFSWPRVDTTLSFANNKVNRDMRGLINLSEAERQEMTRKISEETAKTYTPTLDFVSNPEAKSALENIQKPSEFTYESYNILLSWVLQQAWRYKTLSSVYKTQHYVSYMETYMNFERGSLKTSIEKYFNKFVNDAIAKAQTETAEHEKQQAQQAAATLRAQTEAKQAETARKKAQTNANLEVAKAVGSGIIGLVQANSARKRRNNAAFEAKVRREADEEYRQNAHYNAKVWAERNRRRGN